GVRQRDARLSLKMCGEALSILWASRSISSSVEVAHASIGLPHCKPPMMTRPNFDSLNSHFEHRIYQTSV
ncbi:MAG: hypothetical protein ACLPI9_04475, partial [Halobacteriota archaeon]